MRLNTSQWTQHTNTNNGEYIDRPKRVSFFLWFLESVQLVGVFFLFLLHVSPISHLAERGMSFSGRCLTWPPPQRPLNAVRAPSTRLWLRSQRRSKTIIYYFFLSVFSVQLHVLASLIAVSNSRWRSFLLFFSFTLSAVIWFMSGDCASHWTRRFRSTRPNKNNEKKIYNFRLESRTHNNCSLISDFVSRTRSTWLVRSRLCAREMLISMKTETEEKKTTTKIGHTQFDSFINQTIFVGFAYIESHFGN